MAQVKLTLDIKFFDYFSKWGFGDGDGPEHAIAGNLVELAQECINKALDLAGLGNKYKARQYDPDGIHNNCRISLQEAFGDGDIYVDYGYAPNGEFTKGGKDGPLPEAEQVKLRKVMKDAQALFDVKAARWRMK